MTIRAVKRRSHYADKTCGLTPKLSRRPYWWRIQDFVVGRTDPKTTNAPRIRRQSRGVHGKGSSHGNGIPMGFPREWELDLNKDGNGNWNTTAWDWELLMLVGSQDHSRGFVKSHFATLCALCGFRTNVWFISVFCNTVVNCVKIMSWICVAKTTMLWLRPLWKIAL